MMETLGTLALGGAALRYGFGAIEGADSLRTLAAVGKGLAWAPCLANFAGSAPEPIKNFHKAMEEFLSAYEAQDVDRIILNAQNVQEKLEPLLQNRDQYGQNFKGWKYAIRDAFTWRQKSRNANWDEYLKPLRDLDLQLAAMQQGLKTGKGYSLEDLDAPLRQAHDFMNNEVSAHRGVVNTVAKKAVDGTAGAIKDKYDDLRGAHVPQETAQMSGSPLMELMKMLGRLRSDKTQFPFMIERDLEKEIQVLAKSNQFFAMLPDFIAKNNPKGQPLIEVADVLVTQYILTVMNHKSFPKENKKLIYSAMHQYNSAQAAAIGKTRTTTPQDARLLWQAIAYVLDLDKIANVGTSLEVDKATTLSELSEKIDRSFSMLASVQHIPNAQEWVNYIAKQIKVYSELTIKRVEDDLTPEEYQQVKEALNQVSRQLNAKNYAGALRSMKKLYETGPIAALAVQSATLPSPDTALGEVALTMTDKVAKSATTPEPEIDAALIDEKKKALIEVLTYYSAFKVVDNYCGYEGVEAEEEAVQRRYKAFYAQIEGIDDPADRKQKFLELLDQKLESRDNLSFLSRWVGKKLSNFTVKLVEYFSSEFANVAVEQLQKMMLDPINDPLANNNLGPLRAANNAMLALLFAENEWANDETGALGAEGKQAKIHELVDNQEGTPTAKLIQQVIDGAINHFLQYSSNQSFLSGLKNSARRLGETEGNIFTRSLASAVSAVGQVVLSVVTAPVWILYNVGVFFERKGASYLVNYLDLVNTTIKGVRDAIYNDRKYAEGFDKILLDQLKMVEKLLQQDQKGGGGQTRLGGDKEKKLVEEFVNNLFHVIDQRRQLTPGEKKTRDNILAELSDALNNGTDEVIKGVVQHLIRLSSAAIRDEQGINKIFGDVLDLAAQSLKPNDMGRLWELFTPEELEDLRADPENPEDIHILEVEFARRIGKFGADGKPNPYAIVKRDIDQALHDLYTQREAEIHETLDRVLQTTVETVVKSQVDAILMTPQDAINNVLTTLENELVPRCAEKQTKRGFVGYMTKMKHLQACGKIEEMKKVHADFLHNLQYQMQEMNARRGRDARSDLQMQMLDRMVNRLMENNFKHLANALSKGNLRNIKRKLEYLEQGIRLEEPGLEAMRFNIRTQEKTSVDQLSEWGKRFVAWGAENVSPVIKAYVKSRLAPRAEGILDMIKDPNVFTSLARSGIQQYMQYERREPDNPFKKVSSAASEARSKGFEFV